MNALLCKVYVDRLPDLPRPGVISIVTETGKIYRAIWRKSSDRDKTMYVLEVADANEEYWKYLSHELTEDEAYVSLMQFVTNDSLKGK